MLNMTDNTHSEFHHININRVEQTLAKKKKISILILIIRVLLLVHLLQIFGRSAQERSLVIVNFLVCPYS